MGRIINFAGGGAAYANPCFSAYGVAKCAVVRLTETIAAEIVTPNVTINIIAPGAVATDMLAQVEAHGGVVRTRSAMEEPVRLVRFLAGPNTAHINGRFIHVRDSFQDPHNYENTDLWKLRRVQNA